MVSSDRPVSLEDEVSHSMKEMIGGCCVCSDERGWAENPLVYCDGHGCSVAVHQACYGIVQVPTGPWFCRKCESQERAARVDYLPQIPLLACFCAFFLSEVMHSGMVILLIEGLMLLGCFIGNLGLK
ncbi:hypothetical protein FD755_005887 [Muntiacus reevesi]|uniref:PHD-type domain-containing protein n=2 Tax=Muntiacus TaxID=9885 RepID=A0A5J5MUP9_MUNRE|nr:hypothetical protein FD754_017940 [Muntiacus muntjak]KAB0383970.1 hypothetical protein FD755_005887 [Muntiacus reevesi]